MTAAAKLRTAWDRLSRLDLAASLVALAGALAYEDEYSAILDGTLMEATPLRRRILQTSVRIGRGLNTRI